MKQIAEKITEKTNKNDFVEIKFTGYANRDIFDSNIEEDLKKLNPEAKAKETIVAIGQRMVVQGLDNALEDKEISKEYEITIKAKDGFGERRRELIRTIPLSSFTAQNVNPKAGMVLALDNHVVKILAVSGARVTADFNNPLAGKELKYKFKIIRKINDEKEKIESLFKFFFGFVPEFNLGNEVKVKGQKNFEVLVKLHKKRFKELIGKELEFEEKLENEGKKDISE